ncbi:sulfite exporter TauE/SafE family protein [Novosphingobium sp. TH158]|uniref:sulfite exporter TauE/SafE family protein n=1 Tax=Novosphingobium sp. TH158 TaxID=2067455 RepID=UPI000C7DFFCB|nr:sulfite exporter TauE/SafE family protein [Novosphingobium sp. TH158]PLK26499.1 permease [Novosphingobium sp. TH158]
MDVYLPIANLAVNLLVIVGLGVLTGLLSGMFGVGGGFLTTPLLIFYGVPPTVAAASAASQVTGASVSGVIAHSRRGGVDYHMGAVMVVGGIIGTGLGALLFNLFSSLGQIDTLINILYVVLLGGIGTVMARDAWAALKAQRTGIPRPAKKRRHHPLVANLPLRWRFYRSGLYISPLAPLALGVITGILTMLMGIGGGFVLVPAMLYILGMSANVVVGTSLFQILFTTIATTLMHSVTTHAVDIVLAAALLIGSVTGAQFGARLALKIPADRLRLVLAALVLLVALRMALGLTYRPEAIYTVAPL